MERNFKQFVIGEKLKNGFSFPSADKFTIFCGPCVIESRDSIFFHAAEISKIATRLDLNLVFKSSFDKANRTSKGSFRGIGIEEGLRILAEVRTEFNLPVISDVHSPEDAKLAGEVLDVVQIPAFLCRQTDLLLAAGETNKTLS